MANHALPEQRGDGPGNGASVSLKPVRKARLSDAVVVQLANLILSGDYAVGDKLPTERDLAAELSITRTSLREAIRQLERMGLVSVRQGDGIYVRDHALNAGLEFVQFLVSEGLALDRDMILSLDEARRVFATAMIGMAAERVDDQGLARLDAIVADFPREATPAFLSGEWDFRFFHEIARASGNRVFIYMLNSIKESFTILRRIYTPLDESPAEVAALNARVVEALRAGDGPRAVSIVEDRMRRDARALAALFDQEVNA